MLSINKVFLFVQDHPTSRDRRVHSSIMKIFFVMHDDRASQHAHRMLQIIFVFDDR